LYQIVGNKDGKDNRDLKDIEANEN